MKQTIRIFTLCLLFVGSASFMQAQSCAKSCSKTCKAKASTEKAMASTAAASSEISLEECAKRCGMTVEECAKACGLKADNRVASAVMVRELPTCCYNALTTSGKVCCDKYAEEVSLASAIIDEQGNKIDRLHCAKSKSCSTKEKTAQMASVLLIKEKQTKTKVTRVNTSKKQVKA